MQLDSIKVLCCNYMNDKNHLLEHTFKNLSLSKNGSLKINFYVNPIYVKAEKFDTYEPIKIGKLSYMFFSDSNFDLIKASKIVHKNRIEQMKEHMKILEKQIEATNSWLAEN